MEQPGTTPGTTPRTTPGAQLLAVGADGTLAVLDVAPILAEGRDQLLGALRRQVGGHVDRVRIATEAGWLLVFFREAGPATTTLPDNPHARHMLERLGMDLGSRPGSHPGSFLFLGADRGNGDEAGLTEPQIDLLTELHAGWPPASPGSASDITALAGQLVS
jgi:hypothetical protein